MTFAVSGNNCHLHACYVIVDMDGQDKGRTTESLDDMIDNFDYYANADIEDAKNPQSGHGDIAVFMVKDGQVYPASSYTADNMHMEKDTTGTAETFNTSRIDIQFSELNINPE